MTTKPTEGWAVVSAAGSILEVGTYGSPLVWEELHGDYGDIISVTIIPTADLGKEAARVLLGAGLQRFSPDYFAGDYTSVFMEKDDDGDWVSLAALCALAGQGGV